MGYGMVGLGVGFERGEGDEPAGGGGAGTQQDDDAEAAAAVAAAQDAGTSEDDTTGDGAGAADDDAAQAKNGQRGQSRGDQRIIKLANENRAIRQQLDQTLAEIKNLRMPQDQRIDQERRREEAKRFYQDPAGYIQGVRDDLQKNWKSMLSEQQDLSAYSGDISSLKSSGTWSKEMEQAMVDVLDRYGLTDKAALSQFGRAKALRLAYETATGKRWGEWTKDAYNTRITKERLMRPGGSGGGNGSRGGMLSPEQYESAMNDLARKAMDPDEQSRMMQKLNSGLDAWVAAQG